MTSSLGTFDDQRLLVCGDSPGLLPALHSGWGLADQLGHRADAAQAGKEICFVHGAAVYDNIAHLATSNSHRQWTNFSQSGAMSPVTERLKALRNRAEPRISVRRMAEALGMPSSTYAAYEDPAKFKKPILPLDLAKAIADVLAAAGVPRAEVLALAGVTGEFSVAPSSSGDEEWLEVQGAVAGGVWREQTEWPPAERYQVRFGPSRFAREQRFAVRMEGLSMNKVIPHNSDLECLWIKFSDTPPQPGDLVIVERHAHDLVEMTCKRLARDGEDYVLLSESTEPAFAEPIRLGRPDDGLFTDDEISVVGIVLSAKLNLAPPNLDDRRFPRT